MRAIALLLALGLTSFGFADEMGEKKLPGRFEELYEKAGALYDQSGSEEEAYKLYCDAIAECDQKTLEENPELIYRKVISYPSEDSFEGFKEKLVVVQEGSRFVLAHADAESPLFKAATQMLGFTDAFLNQDCNEDNLEYLFKEYLDNSLRRWAGDAQASGQHLRMQVVAALQDKPLLQKEFILSNLITFDLDDIDLVLGYKEPTKFIEPYLENLGGYGGEDDWRIVAQVEFEEGPHQKVTYTWYY